MRVLQINTVCKSGSTGKIAYDIHTSLLEDGHESAICYGRGPIIDEPNIYKFGSELGWKVHALITRISGITGMASNWSTSKLLKYIKEYRPDVVHLHNIHGYYVNAYRLLNYLKKNKIKTVITLHDDWLFTGRCAGYYLCDKWKQKCGDCKKLSEYPKSIFIDASSFQYRIKGRCFDKFENIEIVCPSNWLANRVKQSFVGHININVIHNGIDTENNFYPRKFTNLKEKHNLTNEKIILAVTPNFSDERKGGKYVLELAKMLEQEENIKIIIIGVNEKIDELPTNVIIMPRIEDQKELAQYYSMADIFIITSRCENFPTVCLEALACGTRIVGFDVGGVKETDPNGSYVEFGDVKNMKEHILKDISLERKINKEKFSKYSMYKEYKRLYSREE